MSAVGGDALQARGLNVRLSGARIVDHAAVALRAGEVVALVGPNGAGKTTLMRALAGLIPADGEIVLQGRALASMSARERARAIAYLPQGHMFHWPLPVATVVALGRHPHGDPFSPPTPADNSAIDRALVATGTKALAARAVTSLSGGERARVALARALATEAAVLLADEPTMSLDPRHQLVVMDLLRRAADRGGAVFAVMHDLTLAARFFDRVVVMNGGRIVADAGPAQALSPARVAEVFGVETINVKVGGGTVTIPWRPL